ncbi:hypothetical protein [Sphingomonas qomolangmaensis]|uniref:Uncharacterized protein n=1 Tax=Sphingomonas qomolangmaensis TaxID=2918765 RepID=A0ABY5LBC3_9SPHN|nr:hypothetical protein [Sphingomonas qomolangmaensis]UUL84072.1 hypothetical protein NMP03_07780 [Sphingomonas qomolangmaensis]
MLASRTAPDALRPHEQSDLETALAKDLGLIAEAAEGRTSTTIRAIRMETELRVASAVRRGHSHSLGMLVAQASYGQMPSLSAAGARRGGPPSKFAEDDDDPGGPISIVRLNFTNREHIEDDGA